MGVTPPLEPVRQPADSATEPSTLTLRVSSQYGNRQTALTEPSTLTLRVSSQYCNRQTALTEPSTLTLRAGVDTKTGRPPHCRHHDSLTELPEPLSPLRVRQCAQIAPQSQMSRELS
eukprot:g64464.t1